MKYPPMKHPDLAPSLFLLAHDPVTGRHPAGRVAVCAALVGAVPGDLLIAGLLTVAGGRVAVTGRRVTRPAEPVVGFVVEDMIGTPHAFDLPGAVAGAVAGALGVGGLPPGADVLAELPPVLRALVTGLAGPVRPPRGPRPRQPGVGGGRRDRARPLRPEPGPATAAGGRPGRPGPPRAAPRDRPASRRRAGPVAC